MQIYCSITRLNNFVNVGFPHTQRDQTNTHIGVNEIDLVFHCKTSIFVLYFPMRVCFNYYFYSILTWNNVCNVVYLCHVIQYHAFLKPERIANLQTRDTFGIKQRSIIFNISFHCIHTVIYYTIFRKWDWRFTWPTVSTK